MSQTFKRYFVSSVVTFVSTFIVAIAPLVQDLRPESLEISAVVAIVVTGARAGFKAILEVALGQLG